MSLMNNAIYAAPISVIPPNIKNTPYGCKAIITEFNEIDWMKSMPKKAKTIRPPAESTVTSFE